MSDTTITDDDVRRFIKRNDILFGKIKDLKEEGYVIDKFNTYKYILSNLSKKFIEYIKDTYPQDFGKEFKHYYLQYIKTRKELQRKELQKLHEKLESHLNLSKIYNLLLEKIGGNQELLDKILSEILYSKDQVVSMYVEFCLMEDQLWGDPMTPPSNKMEDCPLKIQEQQQYAVSKIFNILLEKVGPIPEEEYDKLFEPISELGDNTPIAKGGNNGSKTNRKTRKNNRRTRKNNRRKRNTTRKKTRTKKQKTKRKSKRKKI